LETSRHLLFDCSKKLEVWQGALSRYVEERVWTAEYVCSLIVPRDNIPLFLLLGAILATVWRYTFASVLEAQAFEPRIVLAAVDLAITQARAQLAEKQRQREKQQPPPPVEAPLTTPTTIPNHLYTLSSLYSIMFDFSVFGTLVLVYM
jgi:hypothetical protein